MDYHPSSEEIKNYALSFFNAPENQHLTYHNLAHTDGVVQAATRIGNHYQLNDHDFFVVLAAAWFHDMGYFSGGPAAHEQRSAEKAAAFLQGLGMDEATINAVKACILATKIPQSPTTILEQIVCDADFFHLGTDEFSERNKAMRKEFETSFPNLGKSEWRKGTIKLFQSHHYHTEYCKSLLNKKKQKNLNKLLEKQLSGELEKQREKEEKSIGIPTGDPPVVAHTKKAKKMKDDTDRPEKGIETMFRVASTNHQRLSDMSDNKAHIMISVNAIIISVIIGLVVRRLEADPNILVPTLILLSGSLVAIVFAVLATRPKIPGGVFSDSEIDNKTANLLFFGNFYKMDFLPYYEGMKKVMADSEFLYGSLTRDIYSQGKVLGRKFKYIRISYTIFMYTLVASILAFTIAAIFFS